MISQQTLTFNELCGRVVTKEAALFDVAANRRAQVHESHERDPSAERVQELALPVACHRQRAAGVMSPQVKIHHRYAAIRLNRNGLSEARIFTRNVLKKTRKRDNLDQNYIFFNHICFPFQNQSVAQGSVRLAINCENKPTTNRNDHIVHVDIQNIHSMIAHICNIL